MTEAVSALSLPARLDGRDVPPCVPEFYRAYLSRDPVLLGAILDDNVEWLMNGPAGQLDIYGRRRGNQEVIELVTRIMPCIFVLTDFEIEHLLVQGERVASYGILRARQRESGRALRFRGAHFMRFRDGKLVSFRALADTFDLVEQVVGHPIDITRRIERVTLVPEDDELLRL